MFATNILFFFIPIGIIVLVVAGLYFILKHRNGEVKKIWNEKMYLSLYTFTVLFATLIMFAIGWTKLNQSAFASAFGIEFSYEPRYQECVRPMPINGEFTPCKAQYRYDVLEAKRDFVQGITLMLTAIILGFIHFVIAKKVMQSDEAIWVWKKFLIIGLTVFGIVALIALPVAIFKSINFFLFGVPDVSKGYVDFRELQQIPGNTLGTAIAFLPLWLFFLVEFLKHSHHKET